MTNDANTITVDSYTVMNLYDRGVYDELFEMHQELLDAPLEAAKFYKTLSRMLQAQRTELEQRAPELVAKYERMAQQAAVVGFPYLGDEVAIALFGQKPLDALRSGFDAQEQLRVFLAGHYVMEERNTLREKLRGALEKCVQPFGNEATKNSDKGLDTVAKWLAYRNEILGPVTESDLVADKQFLAQDKNSRLLAPQQQEELAKLLAIYRWLHLSSLWQEGLEEHMVLRENGRLKILRNGVLEDVGSASAPKAPVSSRVDDSEDTYVDESSRAIEQPTPAAVIKPTTLMPPKYDQAESSGEVGEDRPDK